MLGQVESYQQSTEFNCSAAALLAVIKHWGHDYDEWSLATLLKVDPVNGASAKRVVKVARQLGFQAKERKFRSLNEMKRFTDDGIPVIARVLSFKQPNQYHFVVVTDIDDFGVSMMDPNVEGNRRRLTHEEMWTQWGPERIGVVIAPKAHQLGDSVATSWRWPIAAAAVLLAVVGGYVFVRRRRRTLSGYYHMDANRPPTIKKVLGDWVCKGDKAYDPPYSRDPTKRQYGVFWYDINEVLPYREYYHTRETARAGSAYWDALVVSMQKEGWKGSDPAHVMVGKNGCVKVGEGNHRLAVARRIGIDRVPIRLHFWENVAPDTHIKCFDRDQLCGL